MPQRILYFDGDCVLCSGWVQFVLPRDRKGRVSYATLQSPEGQALLKREGLQTTPPESMLVVENGKVHRESRAVIAVLWQLSAGWKLLGGLAWLVPFFLRDVIYRWIARHRYRWFGKNNVCWFPSESERARFQR